MCVFPKKIARIHCILAVVAGVAVAVMAVAVAVAVVVAKAIPYGVAARAATAGQCERAVRKTMPSRV